MEGELSKSTGSVWCILPGSFNMTMNLQIPRHMGQAYLAARGLWTFQENSV